MVVRMCSVKSGEAGPARFAKLSGSYIIVPAYPEMTVSKKDGFRSVAVVVVDASAQQQPFSKRDSPFCDQNVEDDFW